MIKFDITKVTTEVVYLKSVTTALGGSITVLDSSASTAKKEVTVRVPVPMAVARAFIQHNQKITKYLKPAPTAIVRYDGMVIALERHSLGSLGEMIEEGFDGVRRAWEPHAKTNIERVIAPLAMNQAYDWYFDGRYMYSFESRDMQSVVNNAFKMTVDGKYRKVMATTIDLQELDDREKLSPSERSCLAFVTNDGHFAVSAPIWKDLSDVGTSQLKKSAGDDEDMDDEESSGEKNNFSFDAIDANLAVNLNFALKAGAEVGALFGYESVQPLQLPPLMVELCTVNLPNIAPQVRATYDIGTKFTHTMAWLLGLSRKADTLETSLVIRSLMKYLTQRGVFRKNVFAPERVFVNDKTVHDIPLVALDGDIPVMDRFELMRQATQNKASRNTTTVGNIAALETEF